MISAEEESTGKNCVPKKRLKHYEPGNGDCGDNDSYIAFVEQFHGLLDGQWTKDIRTGEGDITICPDQGVNQEQFLSMIRMDVMTVLLSLIESDAATPDNLKVIDLEIYIVK